jgi:hypothetical protein
MEAMKEEAKRRNIPLDDVATEWNEAVKNVNDTSFSFGRMLDWLTRQSLIQKKKARGKSAPKSKPQIV